jgi:uncharacterized cupin superfamily protein
VHTREDEYSIVTEGEIGFRSGDREVVLPAGGYITKPRGELHAMWNAGKVPARIRCPGGQLRAGVRRRPWLPDLIARYQLNPPPAP